MPIFAWPVVFGKAVVFEFVTFCWGRFFVKGKVCTVAHILEARTFFSYVGSSRRMPSLHLVYDSIAVDTMATDHTSRAFDVEALALHNDRRMQELGLTSHRHRSRAAEHHFNGELSVKDYILEFQEEPRYPRPAACEEVEVVPVQHLPSPTSVVDEDEIQEDVAQLKQESETPHPDVPRACRSRSPSLASPLAACLSCNMQFKVAIDFRATGCPACGFSPLPPRCTPKQLVWERPVKFHATPAARRNMTTSQRKAEKRRQELERGRMMQADTVDV